jgi:putative hemolysin
MPHLGNGRYAVRFSTDQKDILAVQRLRFRCFVDPGGGGRDEDAFDAVCRHMLVEEAGTGALAACCRLMPFPDAGQIGKSYSAQFYDLSLLSGLDLPMAEVGRFCVAPERRDGEVLRVAWAALTGFVDDEKIAMLFGCSSFSGTDPTRYLDTFELLREKYLAPLRWRPQKKAPEVVALAAPQCPPADLRNALRTMPPLLRSYLAMGGRVSDHAVIDRQLRTMHVFTGLETGGVPPTRARLLREAAAGRPLGPPADARPGAGRNTAGIPCPGGNVPRAISAVRQGLQAIDETGTTRVRP